MSDRLISEIRGVTEPRIHSKLNDLPSRGQEMIDFCREIGLPLLPWQEFVAVNSLKVKENGRWLYPLNGLLVARQSGKSTFMIARILAGAMLFGDDLQIGTAHTISTARESFKRLVDIVESSKLAGEVKKIRWANGEQEIQFMNGARYIYRASNNATRGISKPEAIHLDELREYKNEATWASIRYTLQAARNPQTWIYSNAGDASSVILNSLRDRALASLSGSGDDIGWWEYSAHPDTPIDGSLKMWEGLAQANPSLGYTIHPENLKMALNDPPDTIRTEMLCQWVTTLNGAVDPDQWETCRDEKILKRLPGSVLISALVVRKRLWLRLRNSTATDSVSSSCKHGRQIWLSTIKPWRTTSRRGFESIRSRRLLTRSKPHPRSRFDSYRQAFRFMTSMATITCKRATNGREPSIQAGSGTQVRRNSPSKCFQP